MALIPGHKVIACGGSAASWKLEPLFDHYASLARHWLIESFDHFERNGWETRTVVVDGCSLYHKLTHPSSDNFHFEATSSNFELTANWAAKW
eukprot:4534832-Prorocentrum_lima.AAC.1